MRVVPVTIPTSLPGDVPTFLEDQSDYVLTLETQSDEPRLFQFSVESM